jgi:hypothetical protein
MISARVIVCIALGVISAGSAYAGIRPVTLRCEYKVDPLTVLEGDTVVWEKDMARELPAGIAGAKADRHWIVFDVGSGSYCFTLK